MRKIAFWLSLIMIFTIPWENLITVESLGTVSRAMGYLVAVFWAITVVVTGRFRALRSFHGMVYVFIIWTVASVFWSVNVDKTIARFLTGLQLAVLVLMLWDLYITPAMLKAGLQAYVLGGFVSVVSTIANYFSGITFYSHRYGASGFNVNDLAIILALGIPVAWYLAVSETRSNIRRVLRLVNYAYIPAAVVAILLTASRAALLSTFPAFLFMLSMLARLKLYVRVLIVMALVSSLFAVLPLVPQASFARIGATGTEVTEGDLNGRLEIWQDGVTSFEEHPVIGIGSGAFADITDTGKVGHNFVLSLVVELGIIGLALFLSILVIVFQHARRQPKQWFRLWLTVLVIWLLGAASHNLEFRKQSWLFLSLIVVSEGIYNRRNESRVPPAIRLGGAAMAGGSQSAASISRAAGGISSTGLAQSRSIQTTQRADRPADRGARRDGSPPQRLGSQRTVLNRAPSDAHANAPVRPRRTSIGKRP